jgi:hypothetical protein
MEGVAKLTGNPASGAGGRRFKSCRYDQLFQRLSPTLSKIEMVAAHERAQIRGSVPSLFIMLSATGAPP